MKRIDIQFIGIMLIAAVLFAVTTLTSIPRGVKFGLDGLVLVSYPLIHSWIERQWEERQRHQKTRAQEMIDSIDWEEWEK